MTVLDLNPGPLALLLVEFGFISSVLQEEINNKLLNHRVTIVRHLPRDCSICLMVTCVTTELCSFLKLPLTINRR